MMDIKKEEQIYLSNVFDILVSCSLTGLVSSYSEWD